MLKGNQNFVRGLPLWVGGLPILLFSLLLSGCNSRQDQLVGDARQEISIISSIAFEVVSKNELLRQGEVWNFFSDSSSWKAEVDRAIMDG
jgi:uncharacterized protein YcfL